MTKPNKYDIDNVVVLVGTLIQDICADKKPKEYTIEGIRKDSTGKLWYDIARDVTRAEGAVVLSKEAPVYLMALARQLEQLYAEVPEEFKPKRGDTIEVSDDNAVWCIREFIGRCGAEKKLWRCIHPQSGPCDWTYGRPIDVS